MELEFVGLELAGSEAEWLRNFLANIRLIKDVFPLVSMHYDCQAAIAIAKNKSYNYKSRHMKLRHDVVKQLLRDGIISIDYVTSELNSADSLTKPVERKLILQTSKEMGLRIFSNGVEGGFAFNYFSGACLVISIAAAAGSFAGLVSDLQVFGPLKTPN
ncbi:uncharacterized protein LOC129873336 [Solanum dulcamara]|uniref:uncharacterized protein LOC129873336 n=1 Tax=Solanum dulcamara TaxID=45834 RepID=UPI00248532E8|nr:uncharacterized protein LOC129873336 [Solanum dulcamara]